MQEKQKKIIFLTENQEIRNLVNQFVLDWENDDECMLAHTSGSTGNPKAIKLSKKYMKASALASGTFFNFQQGQTIRIALSMNTIGGKMLLLRGLLFDMNIEVVEPSKNPLSNIQRPIDFISLVPYQLAHIIAHSPKQLEKVKTILLGGAPVSLELENQISKLPNNVFLSYGMTETMSHVALRNIKESIDFKAIQGVCFSVDTLNRLIIDAPHLGIHKMVTNDVVELISEHSFSWKGRADFVINSAGIKFHPEIIERKLAPLISDRFFIIGEKDDTFGERIVLIVESNKNDIQPSFEDVLTKYEVPKKTYVIPTFVETESGKINRIATKQKVDESKNS